MSEIFFQYQKIEPTTWAYLSSLLMIGLYFKFNRFLSLRNLDLVLLIAMAPGLLLVHYGQLWSGEQVDFQPPVPLAAETLPPLKVGEAAAKLPAVPEKSLANSPPSDKPPLPAISPPLSGDTKPKDAKPPAIHPQGKLYLYYGHVWLLAVALLMLVRLLADPTMVRRPLLEPNLSNGGLVFLGCSLLVFLMANVLVSRVRIDDLKGQAGAEALLSRHDTSAGADKVEDYTRHGPIFYLMNLLPRIPTLPLANVSNEQHQLANASTARAMAIISHLCVVAGVLVVGYWHFDNIKLGIGAATLYLMLPYTAQMTGYVDHVLPAALLMWALVFYRRPALAGALIGLAMGAVYYPLFLLPLWISFYWQRGVLRFVLGLLGALLVMAVSLAFVSEDFSSFAAKLQQMFGLFLPNMDAEKLRGVWEKPYGLDPVYRLPLIVLSVVISSWLAVWPAQKNLGTLLSCSAAMMTAVQFWHGYGGGTYIDWYLPLMLLTVFRPNLEDRVALTVLGEGWLSKRRSRVNRLSQAA